MTRCAQDSRVYFVEEPVFEPHVVPQLRVESGAVQVVVPHLPVGLEDDEAAEIQRSLLDGLLIRDNVQDFIAWYYTPMALSFTDHLTPTATVYDCMDELAAFKGAPSRLKQHEVRLLARADLVLTGGQALYEAKRHQHSNIHPFPSSVDVAHFAQARRIDVDPPDQAAIPHPRLGFCGVIDERMDLALLDGVAQAHPDWHVVMLGPVVKIDPSLLPRRSNIHYLGPKSYEDLPHYLAGWDVALLPFARNEATRFISPTKTPEYMAAGLPVVSTSIHDVVRSFGQQGLVRIADDVPAFACACAQGMAEDRADRITRADAFLRQTSWDGTWRRIRLLVDSAVAARGSESSAVSDSAAAV
jgi:UDP-galactopyranose mutase